MGTAVMAVAAGCQKVPEEFSAPTWTPVAAVPLVDTRFDLSDVLEALTDSLDTVPVATTAEGELAFYHEQGFTGSIAEEWLILPDYASSESVTLGADEALALNLLPPGQSISFSDAASAQLDVVEPEGVLLDRIELSAGTLSFDLTTTMGDDLSGNCTIPGLVDPDGVPYSLNWNSFLFTDGSFSATQDLTGWALLPDNTGDEDNLVEAEYTLTVINNPNHEAVEGESLLLAFGLNGMAFDRVEGDFGNAGISLEEDAVTLSLFDDRFTTSGLEINRASLRLEVENGFGVEATLDSLNLVSTAGGHAGCPVRDDGGSAHRGSGRWKFGVAEPVSLGDRRDQQQCGRFLHRRAKGHRPEHAGPVQPQWTGRHFREFPGCGRLRVRPADDGDSLVDARGTD